MEHYFDKPLGDKALKQIIKCLIRRREADFPPRQFGLNRAEQVENRIIKLRIFDTRNHGMFYEN
jgi:hypothetical protein